jgi:hypothetical protein
MAMYDTIHLWLPIDRAGAFDIGKVSEPLTGFTEHQKEDGRVYISGGLESTYKVNISEQGISLKGSLAKYFLPDNLHTLTRSDSARAIEKMADELCLPIDRAKVTRIDFAQNFLMKYEPEAYYPYLGESQYFKRLTQPKAVYWSNGNRTKLVYNKVAEAKKKGTTLPDVWIGQNVIIRQGVTIGTGSIVGMGSVVTKDIKPYEIVAGCPAKTIRNRFDDRTIMKLLKSKWWEFNDEKLVQYAKYFTNTDEFLTEIGI